MKKIIPLVDVYEKYDWLEYKDKVIVKLLWGDFSVAYKFVNLNVVITAEHKTITDLAQTLVTHSKRRENFEIKLAEAKKYLWDFCIVVSGNYEDLLNKNNYKNAPISPAQLISSITFFELKYGVQFVFTGSRENSAKYFLNRAKLFIKLNEKEVDEIVENQKGGDITNIRPYSKKIMEELLA